MGERAKLSPPVAHFISVQTATLEAQSKRIAKLERALRWYANERNYWPPETIPPVEPVLRDVGAKARRALGRKAGK